jgi:predicted NBD/HSP70 family sugar kinase
VVAGLSESDSLLGHILSLIGNFPNRIRHLVSLALFSILAALIWALSTTFEHVSQRLIVIPAAALLGLALILLIISAITQLLPEKKRKQSAPGGEFIIGCLLGRQTVSCGMLRVRGRPEGAVPAGEHVSVFVERLIYRLPDAARNSKQLYDELVNLIIQVLHQAEQRASFTQCSQIGIATPGLVDIKTGQLTLSVTVPEGSEIPREIARRLIARNGREVGNAFKEKAESEQALSEIILIDNDVRCIARHELSEHQWDQFACLYAGSGVGGAIAIGKQIYFGAHGSASHIGHLELEARNGQFQLETGQCLGPAECDCGSRAFHLEPFANLNGFTRLAEAIASPIESQVLATIRDAWEKIHPNNPGFDREILPGIVASAGGKIIADLPPEVSAALSGNEQTIEEFGRKVLRAYVRILVGGLATLTQMLDPGTIVVCGTLIERLLENDFFAKYLREELPKHLLDSRARPQLVPTVARDTDWRGAALLAWDDGYHHRRARSANRA